MSDSYATSRGGRARVVGNNILVASRRPAPRLAPALSSPTTCWQQPTRSVRCLLSVT